MSNSEILSIKARESTLQMTYLANASHVASSLSCIDILSVIYVEQILGSSIEKTNLERNVFIQSKGHASAGLYSVLAHCGIIPLAELDVFCNDGARLGGHVSSENIEGVELSTGSLGHGIPYGVGVALGKKLSGYNGRVFVLASDGECNEGTTWESALIANQFDLSNLTLIIDRNGFQSLGETEKIMKLEPLADKWSTFGWDVLEIDGHDHSEIKEALSLSSRPKCIIARTIKGKGVSFMEGTILWHYKSPNKEEFTDAIEELGSAR